MNFWEQLTETSIAGIEAWRILALFMAILIAFVAGRMTRFFLRRGADHLDERYPPVLAVALRAIERSVGPALFVVGLRVGLFFLILPETVAGLAQTLVSILFVLATAYVIYCLVDVVNLWLTAFSKKTESKLDDMLAPVVRKSLRVSQRYPHCDDQEHKSSIERSHGNPPLWPIVSRSITECQAFPHFTRREG